MYIGVIWKRLFYVAFIRSSINSKSVAPTSVEYNHIFVQCPGVLHYVPYRCHPKSLFILGVNG